jgi:hypothetical protein
MPWADDQEQSSSRRSLLLLSSCSVWLPSVAASAELPAAIFFSRLRETTSLFVTDLIAPNVVHLFRVATRRWTTIWTSWDSLERGRMVGCTRLRRRAGTCAPPLCPVCVPLSLSCVDTKCYVLRALIARQWPSVAVAHYATT